MTRCNHGGSPCPFPRHQARREPVEEEWRPLKILGVSLIGVVWVYALVILLAAMAA